MTSLQRLFLVGALAMLGWRCGEESRPPAAGPAGGLHTVVVRMTDAMRFEPEHAVLSVGDTVIWINEGGLPHTTTDQPGRAGVKEHNVLPEGASGWDSGVLSGGQRFAHVFSVAGDYSYLCFLHEAAGMVGHLTVREAKTASGG